MQFGTIAVMERLDAIKKTTVRTTARFKSQFDRLIGNLRASRAITESGAYLSNEALMNASWIWMAQMDPEKLARELLPFVEQVREAWVAEDEVIASKSGPPRAYGPTKPAPAKKKGAG